MGIDAEMFVKLRRNLDLPEIQSLNFEICEAFDRSGFMVFRPDDHDGRGRRVLEVVDRWDQDGPSILPEEGETFLRVSLFTRYYGPGYERGNLPFILNVARWLRVRLAPCEVWYGGDSSGVVAEHLDEARERALWEHFARSGHRPYYHGYEDQEKPSCDFCGPLAITSAEPYGGGYRMDGGDKKRSWQCTVCGAVFTGTAKRAKLDKKATEEARFRSVWGKVRGEPSVSGDLRTLLSRVLALAHGDEARAKDKIAGIVSSFLDAGDRVDKEDAAREAREKERTP